MREGTQTDLPLTAAVDREIRGGGREIDMRMLLEGGVGFFVLPDRGYVFAADGRPPAKA